MTWYEILIIIAACLIVIGVIVASVVRKKQGKTGCGCDCGGCSGCAGWSAHGRPAGTKPNNTAGGESDSPPAFFIAGYSSSTQNPCR